jgi:hypothetical protein
MLFLLLLKVFLYSFVLLCGFQSKQLLTLRRREVLKVVFVFEGFQEFIFLRQRGIIRILYRLVLSVVVSVSEIEYSVVTTCLVYFSRFFMRGHGCVLLLLSTNTSLMRARSLPRYFDVLIPSHYM